MTFLPLNDLAMVEFLCDRVGVMYHGRLVEVAETKELFSNARHPYTRALLSAIPIPDPCRARAQKPVAFRGEVCPLGGGMVEISPGHFVWKQGESL